MNKNSGDSVISYLAAVAPALLQLIGVISVGLVDTLRLDKFVLLPEFINFANFLVIVVSISLISLASFWDYNKFNLRKQSDDIFTHTKKYWNVLKIFWVIVITHTIVFMAIILNKEYFIGSNVAVFAQWFSYVVLMVAISFIIYSFVLLKIQEKRNLELVENYIPRLIDSLRRYGHVKDPDIVILKVDRNNQEAVVKLGGASKYSVKTDFTGEMISIEGF